MEQKYPGSRRKGGRAQCELGPKTTAKSTFTCDGQVFMEEVDLLSSLEYMYSPEIRNFYWNIGKAVLHEPWGVEELWLILS